MMYSYDVRKAYDFREITKEEYDAMKDNLEDDEVVEAQEWTPENVRYCYYKVKNPDDPYALKSDCPI